MSTQAAARWNWINGFLTAFLHAVMENLGLTANRGLKFTDFIQSYTSHLQSNLRRITVPTLLRSLSAEELRYIFHMEGEIWGIQWRHYVNFFQSRSTFTRREILETLRFVMTFFLIDRCLDLFLPDSLLRSGRGRRRRELFGQRNGLFSRYSLDLLEIMGPPFYLKANTRQVFGCTRGAQASWENMRRSPIPKTLQSFYHQVSGGHTHFASILERAFIQTRKGFLVRKFKSHTERHLPPGTYAWWYDVLWHYSESMRYRAVLPSQHAQTRPFFWNRSIRWFASMIVTGLLNIVAQASPQVLREWRRMQAHHPVLGPLYAGVTRF